MTSVNTTASEAFEKKQGVFIGFGSQTQKVFTKVEDVTGECNTK